MKRIEMIDSHTSGEPTRLAISGFPDLGRAQRGSDVLISALLCESVDPDACACACACACAGVIFFT